jgi:hypothetical protein
LLAIVVPSLIVITTAQSSVYSDEEWLDTTNNSVLLTIVYLTGNPPKVRVQLLPSTQWKPSPKTVITVPPWELIVVGSTDEMLSGFI